MLSKEESMKKICYTLSCLIILIFTVFCIINFIGFEGFCDSDMYQDAYIAKLMWDGKSIFPSNWTFGNQYFVMAVPNIAAIVYGITGSINLSMIMATTIHTILIMGAFVYLLLPLTYNKSSTGKNRMENGYYTLFALLCLLTAVTGVDIVNTHQGQLFFLTVSYYSSYLITVFFVYGVYLRFLFGEKKTSKLEYILALLFSIATGMQSLRQTAIMVMPIILFEAVRFFYKIATKTYTKKDWSVTLRMAILSIVNVVAYLVVAVIIKPSHRIVYGGTGLQSISAWGEGFLEATREFVGITGIQSLWGAENYEQNIVLGIISVTSIAVVIFALFSAVKSVIGEVKCKDDENSARPRFLPIHMLILLFFFGIFSIGALGVIMTLKVRSIYFFMWYPLVAISYTYLAQKINSVYCTIAIIAIMSVAFVISYGSSAVKIIHAETTEEEMVCQLLEDNEIHYLYGHWNTVPLIAVYSDGEIIPGGWYNTVYEPIGYLNPQDIYLEEYNSEAAYLILKEEKEEALSIAEERGIDMRPIYQNSNYTIYTASGRLIIQ